MLTRLLIRWLVISIAVAAAVLLVPGIEVGQDALMAVVLTAAVLGLVNALIRPLLQFLSCALIILTFGVFSLVINAATLLLASRIAQDWLGVEFVVRGFWPAFWGAIVISIVSWILSAALPDERPHRALPRDN